MFRLNLIVTSLLLLLPTFAGAVNLLDIPAEQRNALGIDVAPAVAIPSNASSGIEVTAKIILPPASVRVIAAPASGLVTTLLHQVGEQVQVGEKIAAISSPDVVEAQRHYLQAQLKHQLATDSAARERGLAEQGLIAKNTWLLTQNEVKLAQTDLDAAAATLRLLGVKPSSESSEITLVAPISGWILETLVEPGQRVEAPDPMVKIGNLNKLGLEIPLTPEQAKTVQIGQSVAVEGGTASGTIRTLQPTLDMAQNVIVRADLKQDASTLRPGQSVKVTLQSITSSDATLSIPNSGLVWAGDRAYVFVESKEGFTPTPIHILNQNEERASISGLSADSRIAIKGVAALKAKWQEAGE